MKIALSRHCFVYRDLLRKPIQQAIMNAVHRTMRLNFTVILL